MSKVLIDNYSFNAAAKTVTFSDYGSVSLENVLLVTNVTDNIIIYNFAQAGKGGTVSGNVLTLDYNTASMDNSDKLQIYYDDLLSSSPISGTVTADLGDLNGAATSEKQDTIIGHLDGVETLLSTVAGDTTDLSNALYTEDATTPANPTGGATLLRKRETPASEVTTDGNWVTWNGTASGAAYVSLVGQPNVAAYLVDQEGDGVTDPTISAVKTTVITTLPVIAGQTGVQGGSGNATANTVRVSQALDVPLPASPTLASANFATGQQALSTVATQIVASRSSRRSVTIVNLNAIDIYLGGSGVTTSTGYILLGERGASVKIESTGAIYGIVSNGTPNVSFLEEYN